MARKKKWANKSDKEKVVSVAKAAVSGVKATVQLTEDLFMFEKYMKSNRSGLTNARRENKKK